MNRKHTLAFATTVVALCGTFAVVRASTGRQAVQAPRFVVDPLWPRPLPNHWLLGSATGVAVDSRDHVFVLNNPNSFNARTEVGGSTTPPSGNCCFPAPPVLEFDPAGNLVGHWGGPGPGYDWPTSPSGIAVDDKGNVWIGGSGVTDGQILKFTHDGKFLMQSGKSATAAAAPSAAPPPAGNPGRGGRGDTTYGGGAPPATGRGGGRGGGNGPVVQPPGDSKSMTNFGGATRFSFDAASNEVFVADGYRNRRIAVIDMTTGAIKRFWGANGAVPDDATLGSYLGAQEPPKQFRSATCAAMATDGTIYACDRGNDRIQLFKKSGTFVKEQRIAPSTLGEGSVWDVAFSRDPQQRFMYVADGMNEKIRILDRQSLQELTTLGDGGRYPGQFLAVNSVATDSKGNLYTTEMYEGKRVQRFEFKGLASTTAKDQGTAWGAILPAAGGTKSAGPAGTVQAPRFEIDPEWPKPLPNHWITGMMVGVAVDSRDHVFIVHRPRSVNLATEAGGAAKPATAECCTPAPPVLEFDPAGNLVNSWGGAGEGYDWPNGTGAAGEHGISVDSKGNVWLGSTGSSDRQILKFTRDGKFIAQFGKPMAGKNSLSTTDFAGVAMMSFDEKANEAYVADGYRNKRVAVIDMTTGVVKRFWGAYGNKPDDADNTPYVPGGTPSKQFGNPVHCAMLSDDGLVYVTDRKHDRIQVFHKDGSYIKEKIIAPETLGDGSMWEIAFSGDKAQKYMYVTDGKNEKVYILDRQSLEVLTSFGDGGRQPGEFFGAHSIATDSKGNIYTTETYEGRRLQKFTYKGIGTVVKGDQGAVWPR